MSHTDFSRKENSLIKHPDDQFASAQFTRLRGPQGLAAEYREGDGVPIADERVRKNMARRRDKPNYAEERLGREVFDTLSQAISLPTDSRLSAFAVCNVTPTGKGSNYVVQVYCIDRQMQYRPEEIKVVLQESKGALRAEIAQHINRKRVPDLKFDVLPPGIQP
jgi:ribosome-binding factor A